MINITDYSISVSYIDILLMNANGMLTTQLHKKRVNFSFPIFNIPYLCITISELSSHRIYISQLIR